MANLGGPPVSIGSDDFTSTSDQRMALGTTGYSSDGRQFKYCVAGISDLVAGNVIQGPAIVTTHLANTPPVVAQGATSFTYTPGATLGTVNQYAGGYLQVDTTPGNGYTYQVSGHPAFALSTAFTLTLADAIQVALTASSRVGLMANPYRGVIQFPVTTATGVYAGVAPCIITAAQYGWLQTAGIASVLIAGTPALGAGVMTPSSVAGSAVVLTTTNLVVAQQIGWMAQIGVDTKNNFVRLAIIP
jgi:hypothetical protein